MANNFATIEIIEYYDCYYRNLNKFKLIGIFDIDEIIMPVNGKNWTDMFNQIMVKLN